MSIFLPRVFPRAGQLRSALIWSSVLALSASTACLDSNMDGGGSGGGGGGGATVTSVFSDPEPTPNPGAAGAIGAATSCVTDTVAGVAETGRIGLPFDSGDVIALCDGWVLIADKTNERLELRNIFTGEWDTRWDLPGAPDDLELDATEDYVYATLPDESLIAAVDLDAGTVYVAATNSAPTSITQSTNHLLVSANAGAELRAYSKPQPTFVGLDATLAGTEIIYNETADQLIGIDDSNITLFDYAEGGVVLTATGDEDPSTGTVLDLDLSPDDSRIAFVNESGNASFAGSNVINDMSTADVDTVMGAWKVEVAPTAAAFNPIGGEDYLLATSDSSYIIFDFARHAEITRTTPTSRCGGSFDEAEFSAGGDIAIAKMSCSGTGTELHWYAPAAGFGDSNSTIGVPAGILATTIGDPFCSTDTPPGPSRGSLAVPRGEDFEPFCDGWAFVTERGTNRVVLKDIVSGTTAAEWDLRDVPVEMVVDEATQFLYVAMGAGGGLARIDLAGAGAGTLVQQEAPAFPQSITLGNGGDVWTTGFYEPGEIGINVTNGPGMVDGGVFGPSPSFTTDPHTFTSGTTQIAFDRTNNVMFISGTSGLASFTEGAGTFDQQDVDDEVFDDLASQIIAASPDDVSIAIVDQNADLIFDLETGDTQDLTDTFWIVDSLLDMTGLAFTGGTGNRLGVATTQELIVFDANGAHDEIVTVQPTSCDVDAEARPGISRGDGIGFYKTDCGSPDALTETIYWWQL